MILHPLTTVQFVRAVDRLAGWVALTVCAAAPLVVGGEKVMMYDAKKGIIFVDKDSSKAGHKQPAPLVTPTTTVTRTETTTEITVVRKAKPKEDIHVGRKKDPPELYYRSGLDYFRNNDYENALKNFVYADSLAPSPLNKLWIGKTYRRMNEIDKFMEMMTRIIREHTQSEVADDALFEIAFYYQTTDEYDSASKSYAQLAEQYPFGTSYGNDQPYLEITREERRVMRDEMVAALAALGLKGEDLTTLCRNFQRTHGLTPTGVGNRETVRAVKSAYADFLRKRGDAAAQQGQIKQQMRIVIAGGGVLLVCLLSMLITGGMVRAKRRRVHELSQVLSDLKL
jgi:hypothetical protein